MQITYSESSALQDGKFIYLFVDDNLKAHTMLFEECKLEDDYLNNLQYYNLTVDDRVPTFCVGMLS